MKKAFSLLLAGVMCVGLLAGCGGQNSEPKQRAPKQHQQHKFHRQQCKYHSDF